MCEQPEVQKIDLLMNFTSELRNDFQGKVMLVRNSEEDAVFKKKIKNLTRKWRWNTVPPRPLKVIINALRRQSYRKLRDFVSRKISLG